MWSPQVSMGCSSASVSTLMIYATSNCNCHIDKRMLVARWGTSQVMFGQLVLIKSISVNLLRFLLLWLLIFFASHLLAVWVWYFDHCSFAGRFRVFRRS